MKQIRTLLKKGFIAGMTIIWLSQPVRLDAASCSFPFYADTWPRIETVKVFQKLFFFNRDRQGKKSEKNRRKKKYYKGDLSDKDREILYKVVSMECDTGYEGSLAVISCMLNRQESKKYPDDLMEVVREDSQFTAYYDKDTGTYPYMDREPSGECIAAVDDALEKGKRNIPSYVYYFRSSDYEYLKGYITYGQIGDNTYFYQYGDL